MDFLVVGSYRAQKLKLSQELGDYNYIYGHDSNVNLNLSYRLRKEFLTVKSSVLLEGSLVSPMLG